MINEKVRQENSYFQHKEVKIDSTYETTFLSFANYICGIKWMTQNDFLSYHFGSKVKTLTTEKLLRKCHMTKTLKFVQIYQLCTNLKNAWYKNDKIIIEGIAFI